MFRWLNGPGAVFRDPLPGSTNYLNAYDLKGNLLRTSRSRGGAPDGGSDDMDGGIEDLVDDAPGGQNIAGRRPIPMETSDDLIPFPMNRQFRSQAVLSEELKDEIYHRVITLGKGVKTVSAELGVEMSRIGAVVRLKSVEKEWVKQVCHVCLFLFADLLHRNDEIQNRLVLKTPPWLSKLQITTL